MVRLLLQERLPTVDAEPVRDLNLEYTCYNDEVVPGKGGRPMLREEMIGQRNVAINVMDAYDPIIAAALNNHSIYQLYEFESKTKFLDNVAVRAAPSDDIFSLAENNDMPTRFLLCRYVICLIDDARQTGKHIELMAIRKNDDVYIGANKSLDCLANEASQKSAFERLNFAKKVTREVDVLSFQNHHNIVKELRLQNRRTRKAMRIFISSVARAFDNKGRVVELKTVGMSVAGKLQNLPGHKARNWWLRALLSGADRIVYGMRRNDFLVNEVHDAYLDELTSGHFHFDGTALFSFVYNLFEKVHNFLAHEGDMCLITSDRHEMSITQATAETLNRSPFCAMLRLVPFLLLAHGAMVPPVRNGEMELKLVHIVWRHGDRSPTTTFDSDPFQEDAWTFGGGGWGQLSPMGMSQHLTLGKMLRDRYVNTGNSTYNFLPSVYDQKTMYVRSTGLNRTLISATSNMLGMYGQDGYGSLAGTDYPDVSGWPRGFIPIPIHTVDYDSDHIGNMDSICPRRDWLWNLAQQSDEVRNWTNSAKVSSVLNKLTSLVNQTFALEDLWIVPDALFIEQIYYNESLRVKNTWYTDDFYNQIVEVNDQTYMFQYGIFDKPVNMNNLDIGLELLKVRSGPLMNDIVERIVRKIDCSYGKNASGCGWINGLKYFAYSAHDETVYAVLVALGIERFAIIPHGYPLYSAAVSIEYWRNTTDNTDYFQLIYHKEAGDTFTVMTSEIEGCNGDYCSIEVLRDVAKKLKTDQPIDQWCLVTESSSSSSLSVTFLILTFLLSKCFLM
ncbi:unnamed protein product [Caenorhabditis sp. 36 PRJEB53466]|nr:unnamed protein product [Caenorhabditis sp. 36 PRJEB53466]